MAGTSAMDHIKLFCDKSTMSWIPNVSWALPTADRGLYQPTAVIQQTLRENVKKKSQH